MSTSRTGSKVGPLGHARQLHRISDPACVCLSSCSAKGLDLPKLPFNMGVRVMEVLSSFGAQEAANKVEVALAAAVTAPSSSTGVSSAAAVSSDSGAATPAAAAAAAVSHSGTSSADAAVPNMHACIAALQAAATAAGGNTSTGQAQDQDTAAVDNAGTAPAPGTQPQPADTQPQQQQGQGQGQGQEQEHSHPQQHNAAAAALAAVAAAVAAPLPAGPCLALAQLLLYSISLLQAVFPVLLQLLSDAAAAATSQAGHEPLQDHSASSSLSVGMAIEQQLRSVVQQLESLGHQVALQQQGQQHNWQQGILQLGLLLVQLCSLLLNDNAAGAAVSQQLGQCANEFVAEGAVYLTQSQQQQQAAFQPDQPPGPALMLQQLTAALQHLQHSLSQAVQRA